MSADPWSTSPLLLALRQAVHCLPRCKTQIYLRHSPCPTPRPPTHAHLSARTQAPRPLPADQDQEPADWGGRGDGPRDLAHALLSLGFRPSGKPLSVQLSLPWCFWFHLLPRALNKAFLPKSFFESILSLIIFVFLSIRYHKIGISSFLPCEIKMKLSNRPRSGNSSSSKCGRWCRNMRITREPVGISGSEIISWFLTAVSEKDLATHSSALVWRILWAEEPGGLLSMGLYTVGHDWSNLACMHACIGEGNGNPLQYSCLENPMDRGAWWATVYWVTKSQHNWATKEQQQKCM